MEYEAQWARAFALTLAIEIPLYMWLLARRGFRARTSLLAATTANGISHPFFWFLFPVFSPYAAFFVLGEAAVIAIETGVLYAVARWSGAKRGVAALLWIAVVVNAISAGVGLLIS
jgi:hypothetical protein